MFEFGRELRRLFGAALPLSGRMQLPNKDGLTGGDGALLELLDLKMLKAEAKGADVAAGRIGARDRARRLLEAAVVWRELARRTGSAEALRKAAADAERAAEAFAVAHRQQGWSRARLEQASCALLGAELFGDAGLEAAAEQAAVEAQRAGGAAGMLALSAIAQIHARRTIASGGAAEARAAARLFNDPIAMLESAGRRDAHLKLAGAEARLVRCDLLIGAGLRLKDEDLIRAGLGDLTAAEERLDLAYEPLTLARVAVAKAAGKAALGEMTGDLARLARAVSALATALDALGRDQSPLDWAKGQTALGRALAQLGEATENETAFAKSLSCYDRAGVVLREAPGLVVRAEVANGRGLALARLAELTGDTRVLDKAEAAFKAELIAGPHRTDPVTWAMLQMQLAQVYATRLALTGRDRGERAAAALAFQSALDVFGEEGLRSLSAIAAEGLERLATAKVG
jgi:tetratricopeptide (TPR) repeat protein